MEKLDDYLTSFDNKFNTRAFNRITYINKVILLKESLNKQGNILIDNEKKFYKILDNECNYFPKIYITSYGNLI